LTIVEGADYFCTVGYIHLGKPSPVREEAKRFIGTWPPWELKK